MSEDKEFEAFKVGMECGQHACLTRVEWGCELSVHDYWKDYKDGKINKEGKYVG